MPPSDSTATSVVPPPISTTIEPVGSVTGRPAAIAAAGAFGRFPDRPALDGGRAGGNTYDDLRGSEAAAVVHLADEMFDHFLRHLEIRDDPVAQWADCLDVARGAAEHQFRLLADGENLFPALDAGDRHHGRLVQDDAAPLHINEGVCRAEIDRHVGRQQTQHSSKHLTANPIEKRSISLSGSTRKLRPITIN